MDQRILDYLKTQRICVLAVEMPDGSPHAATVHFAHAENPFAFYIETSLDSRKAQPLHEKEIARASIVIGTDESNKVTLQLDGEVSLIKPEEKENYITTYFGKFPEKDQHADKSTIAAIKFTPKWWRFSDFTLPEGALILTSH
jgi:uncharacterized protein YhbP (UPF0306 family)